MTSLTAQQFNFQLNVVDKWTKENTRGHLAFFSLTISTLLEGIRQLDAKHMGEPHCYEEIKTLADKMSLENLKSRSKDAKIAGHLLDISCHLLDELNLKIEGKPNNYIKVFDTLTNWANKNEKGNDYDIMARNSLSVFLSVVDSFDAKIVEPKPLVSKYKF